LPVPTTSDSQAAGSAPAVNRPAQTDQGREPERVYVTKAPPAVIVERIPRVKPAARAIWVAGHWEWDPARAEFAWEPGTWQVAPRGTKWVSGQWQRDDRGWYWSPGYWLRRGEPLAPEQVVVPTVLARRPAWQVEGPPARTPVEFIGDAPGQDFFHIPGHYRPSGQTVAWVPGTWAREQPGWEWVTARWIRRPGGWNYRPGFWSRDPAVATTARRSTSAPETDRPAHGNLPPAIDDPARSINPDMPPPPPPGQDDANAIAAAEAADPNGTGVPVGVDPVTGMPYYMIRPPGAYPYARGGVVVPGAVPPFVRNLLDRVLP
jgi:hypothetical protein